MIQITRVLPWRRNQALVPTFVTLAVWRLRQSWRLLIVTWLGILAAVVIACSLPVFSDVSLTAGLRNVLSTTPEDSQIALQATVPAISAELLAGDQQTLDDYMQFDLGSYLSSVSQFMLQVPGFFIVSSDRAIAGAQVVLTGPSIKQAASHLQLLQGRLPLQLSSELEIVITSKTADSLHVTVGSTITLQFTFATAVPSKISPEPELINITAQLPAHVVGVMASPVGDPFWHGQSFESTSHDPTYKAIVSNSTLLTVLTNIAAKYGGTGVNLSATIFRYYYLAVPHIAIGNLDDLIAKLNLTGVILPSQVESISDIYSAQINSPTIGAPGQPSTLERFRDRVAVVRTPLTLLTILALALIIAFVTLTSGILIERQAEVIALLRSRGAKRRQIFSAFALQSLGLGLIALVVGPLLALLLVLLLVHLTFSATDQGALNVITDAPMQTALGLRGYAIAAGAAAVIAMLISIWGAIRRNVLAIRRESARSTSRPLWQRLQLDVVAAIFALAFFGVFTYIINSGAIDARTDQAIALPLSLAAPLFLLAAALLFFLRLFPHLLRFFSWRASRRPDAPPMLALAQVSRAPRQSLRMILLLALSIAYPIFTLVFNASETQQIANTAAQQVGADFSGPLPQISYLYPSVAAHEAAYRKLPGVLSASLGYTTDGAPVNSGASIPLEIRAVDSSTFAQAATWTSQNSSQPLADLLKQISDPARVQEIGGQPAIPAIVDAVAWNAFGLKAGHTFQIAPTGANGLSFTFVAIAEAQHIPTVNDSLETSGAADYRTPGGILVDYNLYSRATAQGALIPNYVWLHTSSDAATLTKLRSALTLGPLALLVVSDRRALLSLMQKDPLYLALTGMLSLGAGTTLLLALIGILLASWLNARSRLTNFVLLRALGSTPRQIAGALSWEQGVVYTVALLLGAFFGALLVLTLLPALVFSNPVLPSTAISSTEFYVIQHVLPTQIVLPITLVIAFMVLIALCAAALAMMARMVARPSLSQVLRLNED